MKKEKKHVDKKMIIKGHNPKHVARFTYLDHT